MVSEQSVLPLVFPRPLFGHSLSEYGWRDRATSRLAGSQQLVSALAPSWALEAGVTRLAVGLGSDAYLIGRGPSVRGTLKVYGLTDQLLENPVRAGLFATVQLTEPTRRDFAETGRRLLNDSETLHDLLRRLGGSNETPLVYNEGLFREKYGYLSRG